MFLIVIRLWCSQFREVLTSLKLVVQKISSNWLQLHWGPNATSLLWFSLVGNHSAKVTDQSWSGLFQKRKKTWLDWTLEHYVCSMLSHCQLSPSATTLRRPGTYRTATMLCAIILSLHCACVTDMVSFANTSLSAWQSVSISTGKPQMVSEKWSSLNFSGANSSKNGL